MVWPTSDVTIENLRFLKQHGCMQWTGDIFCDTFDSLRHSHGQGIFVLSNLNWRYPERCMADAAGFPERTYGAYYELLLSVLQAHYPASHVVILARRDDDVHQHLLRKDLKVLIQPLRSTIHHTPMQSVPFEDHCVETKNVGHGGGMIAIMSLAVGSELPCSCISSDGFDFLTLLEVVLGFVCFVGEGDCRLAAQCAKKLVSRHSDGTKIEEIQRSLKEPPSAFVFESYADVLEALKISRDHHALESHQHAFYAAVYWSLLQGVKSNSRCQCGRVVAPVEHAEFCCRTCSGRGEEHGHVCNARDEAFKIVYTAKRRRML